MKRITKVFMIAICLLMFAGTTWAADENNDGTPQTPPTNRVYFSSLTAARYNPLGLLERARLMYSRRLVDSDNIILRDTFFAIGAGVRLSPSFVNVGPVIELQPLAILHIRVSYEYLRYLKTFNNFQSYPVAEGKYADNDRHLSSAYFTYGHHYLAEPTFQFKVKFIAIQSTFALEYWDVHLRKKFNYHYWNIDNHKDKYFYDPTLDCLIENKKFMWGNDTNLVYTNGTLTLGARYSTTLPGHHNQQHRLGPVFGWTFSQKDYGTFNKPSILAIVQWYLVHPSKVGAMPYVMLGFSFSCDFLKS